MEFSGVGLPVLSILYCEHAHGCVLTLQNSQLNSKVFYNQLADTEVEDVLKDFF